MTNPTPAGEHEGLCERLEDRDARWLGSAGIAPLFNPAGPEAAAVIRTQAADLERLRDSCDGLESDLRMAVQVAWRRGAKEWARLNYPGWVDWLEACDDLRTAARALSTGKTGDDAPSYEGPWLQMLYELRHPERERVGWQDNADLMRAAADEIERLAALAFTPSLVVQPLYAHPAPQQGGEAVREALLNAVISLEELAAAWPKDSLPADQVGVRMANAINNGNAILAALAQTNHAGGE